MRWNLFRIAWTALAHPSAAMGGESSSSTDEDATGILECEIRYRGGGAESDRNDMELYDVSLRAVRSLKGFVSAWTRASGDAAWEMITTSRDRIVLRKNRHVKINISGIWRDRRYYKLRMETGEGRRYETAELHKKGGVFRKAAARPAGKEESEARKKSWIQVLIVLCIVGLLMLGIYCACSHFTRLK